MSKLLRIIPGTVLGIGGVMLQVSPVEAVSNLSQWIKLFFGESPKWLEGKNVDIVGTYVCIILAIISFIWYFRFSPKKEGASFDAPKKDDLLLRQVAAQENHTEELKKQREEREEENSPSFIQRRALAELVAKTKYPS